MVEARPFSGDTWTVTEYMCLRAVGERAHPEEVGGALCSTTGIRDL